MQSNSLYDIEKSYEYREYFISRIKSGIIKVNYKGTGIYINTPTLMVEHDAAALYLEKYIEAQEANMYTDDDVYDLLVRRGEWSDQKQKEFDEILPKHIEYWKIELYNAYFKSDTQKTIRKHLAVAKKEYETLHNKRNMYHYATCAGFASHAKTQFLIANSSFYKNGKPVNWRSVDIIQVLNLYYYELLSYDRIRILARTNPWRDDWSALKKNGRIFESNKLSFEQKALIIWSSVYDSIAESPECPSEDVLQDDDMLDGWLILQKRKHAGAKLADKLNKIKGDEVFLIAETPEDVRKINDLNNPAAASLKKQRFSELKDRGVMAEQQFSDSKLKQSMAANQAFSKKAGGK